MTKEKFRTYQNVFDDFTNRTIFKLISEGHFEGIASPVLIGKESNVFLAKKEDHYVIVKIYRLEACDFNRMYEYIIEDPRYGSLRGKKRKIIFSWVQREFRNLLKAREAGVSVPTPIAFSNNILVMEMIGKESPAPRLKDLPPENPHEFYMQVIENMKKLFNAGLVHADLSPFNILNYNESPFLIDFSQCSAISVSRGKELLMRDVKNIVNFFRKHGVNVEYDSVFNLIVEKKTKNEKKIANI